MKNIITADEWEKIQRALAEAQVPYTVSYDNHNGAIRKIITIDTFSYFPYGITTEV